ncbi:hypothetical protein BDZ91DRAFT_746636 [Kalaharituber pfeilii]|nr:hypothetical protein BDZ91DRAFT_746636 [Kalaharituber pfeilii]
MSCGSSKYTTMELVFLPSPMNPIYQGNRAQACNIDPITHHTNGIQFSFLPWKWRNHENGESWNWNSPDGSLISDCLQRTFLFFSSLKAT